MRVRVKALAGSLLLWPLLGGCATTRPCLVIPAQIELARSQRDQAMTTYQSKLEQVERDKSNTDVSTSRLKDLEAEREELRRLLKEGGVDPDAIRGAKP